MHRSTQAYLAAPSTSFAGPPPPLKRGRTPATLAIHSSEDSGGAPFLRISRQRRAVDGGGDAFVAGF
jgi:hypothetical protein